MKGTITLFLLLLASLIVAGVQQLGEQLNMSDCEPSGIISDVSENVESQYVQIDALNQCSVADVDL